MKERHRKEKDNEREEEEERIRGKTGRREVQKVGGGREDERGRGECDENLKKDTVRKS